MGERQRGGADSSGGRLIAAQRFRQVTSDADTQLVRDAIAFGGDDLPRLEAVAICAAALLIRP